MVLLGIPDELAWEIYVEATDALTLGELQHMHIRLSNLGLNYTLNQRNMTGVFFED